MNQAIESGVYAPIVDADLSAVTAQVRSCMKAEAVALKETGQALLALVQQCGRLHVRFEDYLDRVLGISRMTARIAMAAFAQDITTESGVDHIKVVAKIKDPEVRREVSIEGGTLVEQQARATGVTPPAANPNPEPLGSVERERSRLESRLARLEEEAEEVRTKIQSLDEADEGFVPKEGQFQFGF